MPSAIQTQGLFASPRLTAILGAATVFKTRPSVLSAWQNYGNNPSRKKSNLRNKYYPLY